MHGAILLFVLILLIGLIAWTIRGVTRDRTTGVNYASALATARASGQEGGQFWRDLAFGSTAVISGISILWWQIYTANPLLSYDYGVRLRMTAIAFFAFGLYVIYRTMRGAFKRRR
jgi:hypothetical protein